MASQEFLARLQVDGRESFAHCDRTKSGILYMTTHAQ
jgi:hypothetical protein